MHLQYNNYWAKHHRLVPPYPLLKQTQFVSGRPRWTNRPSTFPSNLNSIKGCKLPPTPPQISPPQFPPFHSPPLNPNPPSFPSLKYHHYRPLPRHKCLMVLLRPLVLLPPQAPQPWLKPLPPRQDDGLVGTGGPLFVTGTGPRAPRLLTTSTLQKPGISF
jgi:hypothetical protein